MSPALTVLSRSSIEPFIIPVRPGDSVFFSCRLRPVIRGLFDVHGEQVSMKRNG